MMLVRTILIGALAVAASAQPPGPPHGRGRGPGPGPGFGDIRFLGAEPGRPGPVVKNAPYSADIVTESTQTLPDGNRIRQSSTARVYRDTEGRTRREQSLNSLNGLAPNANLPQIVFINDPVAGLNYALNTNERTGTRSSSARQTGESRMGRMGKAEPRVRSGSSEQGNAQPGFRGRGARDGNVKTESLGRQTIEGLQAEGTRTTMTIPAGQIGNEQPIQIVSETWYSPELQTVVLSKRSDPRNGETVYRLTNISRTEPARTLFEVPADYKVTESARPVR